jgi:uncharacterized membrane protein
MRGQDKFIVGVIVGAGAMYLLDSDQGARRRSLLRDRGNTRLALGAAGGALALQGVRMKGPAGRALTFLGSGLLSRAASQAPPAKPPRANSDSPRPTTAEQASKPTAKRRRARR